MKLSRIIVAVIFITLFMVAGCGKDKSEEVRIPDYPGAVEDLSYNMGDMALLKRFFTGDSYEEVLSFYKEELEQYDPEIQSFVLEDSRQTKISVVNEKERVISVVVQEFEGEDKVAIVFMGISLKLPGAPKRLHRKSVAYLPDTLVVPFYFIEPDFHICIIRLFRAAPVFQYRRHV